MGFGCTFIFAFVGSIALAAEYEVTPASDLDAVAAKLKPGDVLVLRNGTYARAWTISGLRGTKEAPIMIRGDEQTVFSVPDARDGIIFWGKKGSAHVILEGLTVEKAKRGGIIVFDSQHITIRNCLIRNNGSWGVQTCLSEHVTVENCELSGSKREHGVYFSTTDYPVVKNCRIHDNAGCGIHMNGDKNEGGDGMVTGPMVENNVIYRNGVRGGAAINMDGVEKSVIRNNLIYGNLSGGITSFVQNGARAGDGHRISNNTVVFNKGVGRFALQFHGALKDTVWTNNILICGNGPALEFMHDAARGVRADANVYYQMNGRPLIRLGPRSLSLADWVVASGQDSSSLQAYPDFIDESKRDYRVKPGTPVGELSAGWYDRSGAD